MPHHAGRAPVDNSVWSASVGVGGRRPGRRTHDDSDSEASDAGAPRREEGTQEEVAACRVVTGETGVPAGRTATGACAKAIRAGSGAGATGPCEFQVSHDGRVRVDGEDLGVIR